MIHESSLCLSLVSLTGSHKSFIHIFSLSSRVFCILGIWPLQHPGMLWAPSAGGSSLSGWMTPLRAGATNRRDNRKRHKLHWNSLEGEEISGRGRGRVKIDVKKKKKKKKDLERPLFWLLCLLCIPAFDLQNTVQMYRLTKQRWRVQWYISLKLI